MPKWFPRFLCLVVHVHRIVLSYGFITISDNGPVDLLIEGHIQRFKGASVVQDNSFTFCMSIREKSPDFYGHCLPAEVYWTSWISESHARPAVAPFLAVRRRLQLRGESLRVPVFLEDRSLLTHLGLLQTISVNRWCGCLRWEAHSIDSLPSGSTPANYWISEQTLQAAAAAWATILTYSTPCQDQWDSAG